MFYKAVTFVLISSLCAVFSFEGASAKTAAERREELALIRERMADPDPLMRLAYLEEYAAAEDQTLSMLAVRYALASDDEDLRAIAFRLYVAGLESLDLQVHMPEAFLSELKSAKEGRKINCKITIYKYANGAEVLRFRLEEFDFDSVKLRVFAMNNLDGKDDKYSRER